MLFWSVECHHSENSDRPHREIDAEAPLGILDNALINAATGNMTDQQQAA